MLPHRAWSNPSISASDPKTNKKIFYSCWAQRDGHSPEDGHSLPPAPSLPRVAHTTLLPPSLPPSTHFLGPPLLLSWYPLMPQWPLAALWNRAW